LPLVLDSLASVTLIQYDILLLSRINTLGYVLKPTLTLSIVVIVGQISNPSLIVSNFNTFLWMVKGSYPIILLLDFLKTKDMLIESTFEAIIINTGGSSHVKSSSSRRSGSGQGGVGSTGSGGSGGGEVTNSVFAGLAEAATRFGGGRNSIVPQGRLRMGSMEKSTASDQVNSKNSSCQEPV
jgi:hypothetical protein